MDQAHVQIADLRAVQCPVEECVLSVENSAFQSPFDNVVVQWSPSLPQKRVLAESLLSIGSALLVGVGALVAFRQRNGGKEE